MSTRIVSVFLMSFLCVCLAGCVQEGNERRVMVKVIKYDPEYKVSYLVKERGDKEPHYRTRTAPMTWVEILEDPHDKTYGITSVDAELSQGLWSRGPENREGMRYQLEGWYGEEGDVLYMVISEVYQTPTTSEQRLGATD